MIITAISDTHCEFPKLPGGDLLIHAGDFSRKGREHEVKDFMSYLTDQLKNYENIIFCAGNHELTFERNPSLVHSWISPFLSKRLIYLQEEEITIQGFKVYAAPQTPLFFFVGFQCS